MGILLAVGSVAQAQSWSALLGRGDLPRTLPRLEMDDPLLWRIAPRADLLWVAGNPAALATRPLLVRSEYSALSLSESGQYRRPLDPAHSATSRVASEGWGALGAATPAWGRVQLDRERWSPSSQAVVEDPYRASPFVFTDTTVAPIDRNRVRLEAMTARLIGNWALGASLGYEARQHETIEAAVSRRSQISAPAAALGVLRRLGGLEAGLHAGVRRRTESMRLIERGGEAVVHELVAYRDVPPINVTQTYFRRIEETAPWAGVGIAGVARGWRWSASGDYASLRERRWTAETNDPAADRWVTRTTSLGIATGGAIPAWRGSFFGEARHAILKGTGWLAGDSLPAVFDADESVTLARAELRLAPVEQWRVAFETSYAIERRRRTDLVTEIFSDIRGHRPAWGVEAERILSSRFSLGGGLAMLRSWATAQLPNPVRRGRLYQELFAPELSLVSRDSRSTALRLFGSFRLSARHTLRLQWLGDRLAPTGISVSGPPTDGQARRRSRVQLSILSSGPT